MNLSLWEMAAEELEKEKELDEFCHALIADSWHREEGKFLHEFLVGDDAGTPVGVRGSSFFRP
jgi:hypothetical protein